MDEQDVTIDDILEELEDYWTYETRQEGDITTADVKARHPHWTKHRITSWLDKMVADGRLQKIPKDENDTGMNLYRPVKDE